MEIGFETIGNATLICHDRKPVLVTDPWVVGSAYFGSWGRPYEIPEEQMSACRAAEHVWFSHGHPDHLNPDSLELFRGKKVLVPDHVGRRLERDLTAQGFDVRVLPDRKWHSLSERVRVLCIADQNQDAILLVDVNGRLLLNLNDAANHGWGAFVRDVARPYRLSFLLGAETFGDGDMINLFAADGSRITPAAAKKKPIGRSMAARLDSYGARYTIPFSSIHRYQRADSVWANEHVATLDDCRTGFDSTRGELLPAFVRWDCTNDRLERLAVAEVDLPVRAPEEFGDRWDEPLDPDEAARVAAYFGRFEHLAGVVDAITMRVGGRDNVIPMRSRGFERDLIFEVPRQSLMTAVDYQVFDDLLLGNFMRTTFHGRWQERSLYPWFCPYVAKYGDNGGAHSEAELERYFAEYAARAPREHLYERVSAWLRGTFEQRAINVVRSFAPTESRAYRALRRLYRKAVKPKLV